MTPRERDRRGSENPPSRGARAGGRELDLLLPDSPAVRDAYAQAEAESQPWLFNHVMRSWLYGAKLAQRRGLAPDAELVAVAVPATRPDRESTRLNSPHTFISYSVFFF